MLSKEDVIGKTKSLNLPSGQYILCGGSALAARSIRSTKDLDIVVTPELFEQLQAEGWPLDAEYETRWNRKRLKKGDVEMYPDFFLEKKSAFLDVYELINKAEIVDGLPFQPLEHLIMCKLDSGRPKDLKDVELIRAYLEKLNASTR